MTWKSFHHRGEVLRTVIAAADARRDGLLPMDVAGVTETFGDELDLLGALQLRWHTRLAGRIERELMRQPMDLEQRGGRPPGSATADELPGVRAILDRYRADPLDAAMAEAMVKSRRQGAPPAGRDGRPRSGTAATPPLPASARRSRPAPGPTWRPVARTSHRADSHSFLDRLKAAIAA